MTLTVEGERQGKHIVYRLTRQEVVHLWGTLRLLAEERLFELQDAVRQLGEAGHEWQASNRDELLEKASNAMWW